MSRNCFEEGGRGRRSDAETFAPAGLPKVHFRPVVLATLTTFGGLAPMAFETSRQARFLIPMALSPGYGIFFAGFIRLVLVPSLHFVVEGARGPIGMVRGHSVVLL